MTVGLVAAWTIVVALGLVVGSVVVGRTGHAAIAVVQDGLPFVLVLAWIVTVLAAVTGHWLLAVVGIALVAYHVRLLLPRVLPDHMPRWVASAPRLRLLVANVFIDNQTPRDLARVLLDTPADVIVIAEWNPTFVAAFDAAGGEAAFPHRLFDPDDHSDYAVAVLSAAPLRPASRMVRRGELAAAQAVVRVGSSDLTFVALNPMAVVDPDGYPKWDAQLDTLHDHLHTLRGAVAVAGDLNTTTFRPRMRRLLSLGLRDAHESLGRGLSASFKLSADGVLAAPGAVVRLDHVLTNRFVRAVTVDDRPSAGSDHVPFVMELAVRPSAGRRSRRLDAPGGEGQGTEQAVGDEGDAHERDDDSTPVGDGHAP